MSINDESDMSLEDAIAAGYIFDDITPDEIGDDLFDVDFDDEDLMSDEDEEDDEA